MIENEIFQKAIAMGEPMRSEAANPNSELMTKLLFDARFLCKKLGGEVPYWASAIFRLKMILSENEASKAELEQEMGIKGQHFSEIIAYLKNMSEIMEKDMVLSLNPTNPFSKIFVKLK